MQRFISEDPLEFSGGDTNLFAYVGESPTISTDPTGTFFTNPAGAGYGAIAGGISGYISSGGSLQGVAIGALAGGMVGFVNPFGASAAGSAAGGFLSSLAGQVGGNAVNPCINPINIFNNIDYDLAIVSGLGGGAGRAAINYFANSRRSAFAYMWTARFGDPNPGMVNTVGALLKGTMSGVAQWFYKTNTFSSSTACPCQ